jgi:DNA-binding transcriptional MerR regulator
MIVIERNSIQVQTLDLDSEWLELIRQAKKMGLSVEEIRYFLGAGPTVPTSYKTADASNI